MPDEKAATLKDYNRKAEKELTALFFIVDARGGDLQHVINKYEKFSTSRITN